MRNTTKKLASLVILSMAAGIGACATPAQNAPAPAPTETQEAPKVQETPQSDKKESAQSPQSAPEPATQAEPVRPNTTTAPASTTTPIRVRPNQETRVTPIVARPAPEPTVAPTVAVTPAPEPTITVTPAITVTPTEKPTPSQPSVNVTPPENTDTTETPQPAVDETPAEEPKPSKPTETPWTELTPATPVDNGNDEKPTITDDVVSVPWTELVPATPIEKPAEKPKPSKPTTVIPWTELTPATPIEKFIPPAELVARIETSTATLKEAEVRIKVTEAFIAHSESRLAEFEKQLPQARANKDTKKAEFARIQAEHDKLVRKLNDAQAESQKINAEYQKALAKARELNTTIENLKNSNKDSWYGMSKEDYFRLVGELTIQKLSIYRQAYGAGGGPLAFSPKGYEEAREYSETMARAGYIDHHLPGSEKRGYSAENILYNGYHSKSEDPRIVADRIFKQFKDSVKGHDGNMRWIDANVAAVALYSESDGPGAYYATMRLWSAEKNGRDSKYLDGAYVPNYNVDLSEGARYDGPRREANLDLPVFEYSPHGRPTVNKVFVERSDNRKQIEAKQAELATTNAKANKLANDLSESRKAEVNAQKAVRKHEPTLTEADYASRRADQKVEELETNKANAEKWIADKREEVKADNRAKEEAMRNISDAQKGIEDARAQWEANKANNEPQPESSEGGTVPEEILNATTTINGTELHIIDTPIVNGEPVVEDSEYSYTVGESVVVSEPPEQPAETSTADNGDEDNTPGASEHETEIETH